MSAITAESVKVLREKTGAGMMDCKKALTESQGDMDKAVEFLRKQGIASAAKKSGRLASEGLVDIARDGQRAAIVEVNCETDFVGKTEEFQKFIQTLAQEILKSKPADLEGLLKLNFASSGKPLELVVQEMVAKIGENISIRRFSLLESGSGEMVGTYIHMGNKIGSVVRIKGDASKLKEDVLKDVAMHIAAAIPRFVHKNEISSEERAKEKEIYLAQLKDSGKPAEILEKIVEGKLSKFASEVCLEDQIFVKDPTGKKSVLKHLQEIDPSAKILQFVRYQVGEGMAKKEEDFAAEVAKQLK